MDKWYEKSGQNVGTAVSTRIKISRNIKGYPFPNKMNSEQQRAVNKTVYAALFESGELDENELQWIEMSALSDSQAAALAERGVVSGEFICDRANKVLLLSKDESISIALGDEDHITLRVMGVGLCLDALGRIAEKYDNIICSNLAIAFDEHLGFLTACPTKLGTALTCSVLLHLPALKSGSEVRHMAQSVSRIGLDIHPYSDMSDNTDSAFYLLSNRITLGISESTAKGNLDAIARQLIRREEQLRTEMNPLYIEDAVFRALALLKSARKIDAVELERLLSDLRLGISQGIVDNIPLEVPFSLMQNTKPNTIVSGFGEQTADDVDCLRAQITREALS